MSKTLVAFFSATGTTKKIAEDIAGEEHRRRGTCGCVCHYAGKALYRSGSELEG